MHIISCVYIVKASELTISPCTDLTVIFIFNLCTRRRKLFVFTLSLRCMAMKLSQWMAKNPYLVQFEWSYAFQIIILFFLSTIYSLTIGIFSMETNKLIFVSAKHYRIHHTNGRYFSLTDSGMLSFTRHANVFNEFMRRINIYLKGIREKSVFQSQVKSVRVFFASFLALRDIRNDCFFLSAFSICAYAFPIECI